MFPICRLPRSLIAVKGADSSHFLQGLCSNLVNRDAPVYAGFFNAQGRVLFDAFVVPIENQTYLIDCHELLREKVMLHLKRYKLRANIEIEDMSQKLAVFSAVAAPKEELDNFRGFVASFCDTRVPRYMGIRLIAERSQDFYTNNAANGSDIYDGIRAILGIPEGPFDIPPGESLPLEASMEYLNAISFKKGCYIGQELTARTFHTGVVRKRICPVFVLKNSSNSISDEVSANAKLADVFDLVAGGTNLSLSLMDLSTKLPNCGADVSLMRDGRAKVIGKMRSSYLNKSVGLCVLRLAPCFGMNEDAIHDTPRLLSFPLFAESITDSNYNNNFGAGWPLWWPRLSSSSDHQHPTSF